MALTADDTVSFGANGDVTGTGDVTVNVTANVNTSNGDGNDEIFMADGALIDAGSGTITLSAVGTNAGSITLGGLTTTNATSSAVDIDTAGAVVDGGNTHVDIVANSAGAIVTIDAVSGVGSGNALETTIATLDVDNGASGGAIQITETDGLTVTNATQSADNDANDIIITSTAGAIAVGVIAAGTGASGDVTLTATGAGGAITDNNAGTLNITADVLTIDAAEGVGSGDALETTVASVDIDNSTSGNIEITETNGLTVTKADQATDNDANDIIISSTTGAIAVSVIEAGAGASGDVTLTATGAGGAITDNNGATLNITADVLTIDAREGVGSGNALETSVASVDIDNSTTGNIEIVETNDIIVIQLDNDVADDDNGTTGAISLVTTNGSITVEDAGSGGVGVTAIDGNISLFANGTNSDLIVENIIQTSNPGDNGSVSIGLRADDTISFTADGDVTGTGNVLINVAANLTFTNGDGNDELLMADGAVINAGSGKIILLTSGANGGDITVGQLITTNTATDAVSITSNAAVVDGGDTGGADIVATGGTLVIDAVSGIGSGNALETSVATLNAANTTSNNIQISEADAITLGTVDNDASGGTIAIDTTDGTITTGAVAVTSNNGTITLTARDATATDDASPVGIVIGTGGVSSGGGAINLLAADDISVGGAVNAGTGTATITADAAGLDTFADDNGEINGSSLITAGTADLDAAAGIGNTTALELAASNISADNSVTGNIDLDNALATNVSVTSLTTTTGTIIFDQSGGGDVDFATVTTTNGAIDLENTQGDLTVSTAATAGGTANITLLSSGTAGNAGNIILTGTVTATGDTVIIDTSGGSINGAGLVTAATADLDADTGIGNTTALELVDVTQLNADTTTGAINIDNDVTAVAAAVTVNSMTTDAGAITYDQFGNQVLALASVDTNNGDITVNNAGGNGADITIGLVTADTTNDVVTITSAGAIDDFSANNDLTIDVIANTIDLNAADGIGATAHVDLRGINITADTTAGAINLTMLQPNENVNVNSLTTTGAAITFNHTGDGSNVIFDQVTTTGANNITLTSYDGIEIKANGLVQTDDGSIIINADNDGIIDAVGLLKTNTGAVLRITNGASPGAIDLSAYNFDFSGGSVINSGTAGIILTFTEGTGGSLCLGDAVGCATTFDNGALSVLSGGGVSTINLNVGDNFVEAQEADLNGAGLTLTSAHIIEVDDNGSFTFAFENADFLNFNTSGGTTGTIGGDVGDTDGGLTIQNVDAFTALTSADAVSIFNNGGVDTTYNINTQGAGAISITQSADNIILSNIATTTTLTADASAGTISDVGGSNNTISVGGLADLTASGGIDLFTDDAGDVTNFGSLTFNSGGTVSITENSATILAGTSTANVLDLNSGGSITDDGAVDLTVTGNADFADTGGAGITLDDDYSFGTLTFNSTGSVIIAESDATVLSGTSTAGTLELDSDASISDDGTANVTVTGLADFDANSGTNDITLNDTYNFGSLTFDGAVVDITEASAMVLADNSTATTLTLTSNGAMTDTGTVTVTGVTTLDAGAANDIILDSVDSNFDSDDTGDAINVTNGNDVTITDADGLTVGAITATGDLNVNIDADATNGAETLDLRTGTFTVTGNINLDGTSDTLIGRDGTTNLWTLDGADAGNILAGAKTFNYTDFANLVGGDDADTFNVTTGTVSGVINGNMVASGAVDTLSYAGGPAATITLTADGSLDGYQGNATSLGTAPTTPAFNNINELIGSGGADTLTGDDVASIWAITNDSAGPNTYEGGNVITFSGFENLTGNTANDIFNVNTNSFTGNISDTGGANTFNIASVFTGNLTGGVGVDTFNISAEVAAGGAVTGGAGANVYNLNAGGDIKSTINVTSTDTLAGDTFTFAGGDISGDINVTGNATWNQGTSTQLTSGVVKSTTGTGNVQIPVAGVVTIGGSIDLSAFSGFTGHLIVGGSIDPIGPTMTTGPEVTITATDLSLNAPLVTAGNITLLGNNIDITDDITAGGAGVGELVIIGAAMGGPQGSISATNGLVTLSAGSGFLITDGALNNTTNMILDFGGGSIEVASGTNTSAIQFGPGSNATGSASASAEMQAIINRLQAQGFGSFNVNQVVISNPAADLIGLEELGFIDTGLFEEDLTLFGVIGNGIALALAQCEEIEGCAPTVTDAELAELIAQLEVRLEELQKRCDAGDQAACGLIEGYKQELENFMAYRKELQEYLTAGEEELQDDFTEEFEGEVPGGPATPIDKLARMLETIKARITWLEGLKTDPEARARLGEKTGIELTQEMLEAIIHGAKEEAKFIEKQIEQMKGIVQAQLQASVDPIKPLFVADSADYSLIQNIKYGPSLLNIGQTDQLDIGRLY